MTQPAKAQEPSMEEILASIRRIIADDESKPASPSDPVHAAAAEAPKVEPVRAETSRPEPVRRPPPAAKPEAVPAAAAAPAKNNQDDIDAMLAGLDDEVIAPVVEESPPEPEVLELTESMAMPSRAHSFRTIDSSPDVEFSESVAAPEPAPREPPRARPRAYEPAPMMAAQPEPAEDERPAQPLLSGSTIAAVDSAFNSLAHTVFAQNARTLEDLVKEMLRPMLKSWLDDNLPQVVERIVKAEIERVSRGR